MSEEVKGVEGSEKSPEEFRDWVALERNIVHIAMAQKVLRAITVTGLATETFVGWTLGGIGAAVVLLVSNLDKLSPALTLEGLITSICWLTLAAVFGLFAKVNYHNASTKTAVGDAVSEGLLSALATYHQERKPLLVAEAERVGIHEFDDPEIKEAFRMALNGQPMLARVSAWWGGWVAARSRHPQLTVEGWAARWTYIQMLNSRVMMFLAVIAVLNTLCFLARPTFFTCILSKVF